MQSLWHMVEMLQYSCWFLVWFFLVILRILCYDWYTVCLIIPLSFWCCKMYFLHSWFFCLVHFFSILGTIIGVTLWVGCSVVTLRRAAWIKNVDIRYIALQMWCSNGWWRGSCCSILRTAVNSNATLYALPDEDKNSMGDFVVVNSTVPHITYDLVFLVYIF